MHLWVSEDIDDQAEVSIVGSLARLNTTEPADQFSGI